MTQQDQARETSPLLGRVTSRPSAEDHDYAGPAPVSRLRAASCMLALGVLIMLQATNISILTVTQSAIALDLNAFEQASWFTSAYLIATSSSAPIHGKLAQILTPRISLAISAAFLAVGTLLTAVSNDFVSFLIGRAITGIGGGGTFTISQIIAMDMSGPERRGLMIGIMNTILTIGVSFGATIAGILLPLIGWRPLFWIQTPTSIIFGTFLLFAIPRDFSSKKQEAGGPSKREGFAKLDYVGAITLTLSIVLLLIAISSPRSIPILPVIASLIIFAIFLVWELRFASEPIIPIALLRSRGLFFSCMATVGYMMSRWTVLFYVPLFSIAVKGWSPGVGGAMLIPTNFGFGLGGLLAGWLHIKGHKSFYWSTLLMYGLFPVTLLVLSLTSTATSSPVLLVFIVFFNGLFTGASLNYSFAHVLFLTPTHTHYMVTSLVATFRGFAGSFASAAGGGYFVRVLRASLTRQFLEHGLEPREGLIRQLLGSPALVQQLEGVEKVVAVEGYTGALMALWQGAAVLALMFAFVQACAGWKPPVEEAQTVLVDEEE